MVPALWMSPTAGSAVPSSLPVAAWPPVKLPVQMALCRSGGPRFPTGVPPNIVRAMPSSVVAAVLFQVES